MAAAYADLAADIAATDGLKWKIWTENAVDARAGGIYLFKTREAAEAYAVMHTDRLQGFGVSEIRARFFRCQRAPDRDHPRPDLTWLPIQALLGRRARGNAHLPVDASVEPGVEQVEHARLDQEPGRGVRCRDRGGRRLRSTRRARPPPRVFSDRKVGPRRHGLRGCLGAGRPLPAVACSRILIRT
jgi:hypothetical protein